MGFFNARLSQIPQEAYFSVVFVIGFENMYVIHPHLALLTVEILKVILQTGFG
jgi:hypothetical protein